MYRGTAEFRENPENTCSEYGSGLRQSPKEQPPQLSRSTEDSDHTEDFLIYFFPVNIIKNRSRTL